MKIKDLYTQKKPVCSFEVFPPKKDSDIARIYQNLGEISSLKPDFISVTYGAGGGGNVNRTTEIAAHVLQEYGVEAMAHLTCYHTGRERVSDLLDEMRGKGIENVLAMRGDIGREPGAGDYHYADELIRDIRARGDFCIGAACYPEGHIDCDDMGFDTDVMLRKQDAGADFFVTQLFFDNELFFRFLDRARTAGVKLPISAGVMPFLSRQQIERMIFMCGASLPSPIIKLLHKYESSPDDLRKAGIEYASEQLAGLLEQGVDGVHVYVMNNPATARACLRRIGRA